MASLSEKQNKKTILIVDDNKNNCEMCKIYLEMEGYAVLFADHGKSGLRLIREVRPDLILLDIVMPVMDGYQLLEKLKKDSELSDIPVMVHSVRSDPHEVVRTLKMGANDFIKKPFDVDELIARVDKQFAIKKSQDSLKQTSRHLLKRQQRIEAEMEKWREQAESFQKTLATSLSDKKSNRQDVFNLTQALKATEQVSQLLDQVMHFHHQNSHEKVNIPMEP